MKTRWQNIALLTVAGFINAFGVTVFLSPVSLYDGGFSGTSMLLAQLMPDVPLALFLILLNFPLFLFGYKRQGKLFTIYSLYAVSIYSLGTWLITYVLPSDFRTASPIAGSDLFLCALFGGLISGLGSGLTIRYGGAIDGIEVLAVTFAKKLNITVGTFVMIYNIILYVIAGVLLNTWLLPLYSIVAYGAGLKMVDFIVEGIDRSKAVLIVTEHGKEVNDALTQTFESGVTRMQATGGYSNSSKEVIYFVVNRFQISKMRNVVHSIDPYAFMTISEAADVFRHSVAETT